MGAPTYIGDFSLPGRELRDKGINRIGNLLVPNNNYVKFEEWLMPILDKMLVEHHICNANLMRNGADFSLFVNTASEFDGSDSGARPDEAISWGKIRKDATPVKIYGETTLIFPLLVAETF